MLNNIKIGPKLICGFLIVAIIGAIIGFVGLININTIGKNKLPAIQALVEMGKEQNALQYAIRGSMLQRYWDNIKLIEDQFAAYDDAGKNIEKCKDIYKSLPKSKEEDAEWQRFIGLANEWEKTSDAIINNAKDKYKLVQAGTPTNDPKLVTLENELYDVLAPTARKAFGAVRESMDKIIEMNSTAAGAAIKSSGIIMPIAMIIGAVIAILLGLFLTFSITGPLTQVVDMIKKLARGAQDTKAIQWNRGDELGILAVSMNQLYKTLKSLIEDDGGVTLEAAANKDLTKRMTGEYEGSFAMMKDNINMVIGSLDEALTHVVEATEQVSSASQQISSGSQSLAQGANEQASSLEEVSSSLEEMSSMTKQNADNANQAKNLAAEANLNATNGTEAMSRMSESINKIKESSDQTAKIVKTIDEIAMQTNLLALNAAVEAARAGEAGRGFAVVAEEVRNLAQRSAQAAKNTADMISDSVKNAEGGVKIAGEVSKSFEAITGSVKKVNDLIAEIAAASGEQSQGIEQVNTAVAQMDKVTQQNAANSEESASAAEEMSSQAEELQSMVVQFILSSGTQKKTGPVHSQITHVAPTLHQKPVVVKTESKPRQGGNGKGVKAASTAKINAEAAIPMNEEVLKEF